jgi:sporulation protein YlmC with PRC-barrel domain
MATLTDVQTWKGRKVVDPDGDKVGTIDEIFLDRQTGEPAWATVKTGLFGRKSSFVPLRGAELTDDGDVRIMVDKDLVKDAPKVDADEDLTPEEERRLWEHYGLSDYDEWQGEDRTTGLAGLEDEPAGGREDEPAGAPAVVGVRLRRVVIVSAPAGDDR